MTVQELRAAIEASLRRPIHSVIWHTLTVSDEIDEYALKDNVAHAISLYRRAERAVAEAQEDLGAAVPRPTIRTAPIEMDDSRRSLMRDEEQLAAVVRAEYFATAAALLPSVRALRAEFRADQRLSREEAATLLRSQSGPRIRSLADDLAERYRWPRDHAIRFLLCDDIPLAAPITPFDDEHDPYFRHVTLSASVEPWVSAETVARVYRAAQQRLSGKQRHYLRDDAIDVLRFCMNQVDQRGRLPTWSRILAAWNRQHPNDQYKNAAAIRKAFVSAEETLIPEPLRIARRRRAERT